MNKFPIICFLCCLTSGIVQADVQITVKGDKGRTSTFSSDGTMARIEDRQMPGYVIINSATGEFFMVDPKRNEIMKAEIGNGGVAVGSSPVRVSLEDKGGGPKISGYDTRKLEMSANGENCGTVYASRKLLNNAGVRAIFESMRSMQQFSRSMKGSMGGMGSMMSICELANMQLADAIDSSGVPMRVIDRAGKLASEVVAVDTGKKFPGDHYKLPAGMKVVDQRERMKQAGQQTRQMMENMPDMDELMKQIQQGGGQMTDEMQQQMQEMMEQLQQQSQ